MFDKVISHDRQITSCRLVRVVIVITFRRVVAFVRCRPSSRGIIPFSVCHAELFRLFVHAINPLVRIIITEIVGKHDCCCIWRGNSGHSDKFRNRVFYSRNNLVVWDFVDISNSLIGWLGCNHGVFFDFSLWQSIKNQVERHGLTHRSRVTYFINVILPKDITSICINQKWWFRSIGLGGFLVTRFLCYIYQLVSGRQTGS